MSIGPPGSKSGLTLVQRLDSMLGAKIGQQGTLEKASGSGHKVVIGPNQSENITQLKNPPQNNEKQVNSKEFVKHDKAQSQNNFNKITSQIKAKAQLPTVFNTSTKSAPTTLSYGARVILALVNKFPTEDGFINGKKALLSTYKTNALIGIKPIANEISKSLAKEIKQSGLFYESHLVSLLKGKFSLEDILKEPQARFMFSPTNTKEVALKTNDFNANLLDVLADEESNENKKADNKSSNQPVDKALQHKAAFSSDQLQQLVRQQLEVLANQSIAWRGEIWPGANMECEFLKDESYLQDNDDSESSDEDSKKDKWTSTLNLNLPLLGSIKARLDLNSNKIKIQLVANESEQLLKDKSAELIKAFKEAGLIPEALSISTMKNEKPVDNEGINE